MQKYFQSVTLYLVILVGVVYQLSSTDATVDYSYCRAYNSEADGVTSDEKNRSITFMGHTWDKNFFLLWDTVVTDFFQANAECIRLGLEMATVRTDCEYGVLDKWFKKQKSTTYSFWIAAMRFGDSPLWYPSREQVDLSGFGFKFIPGPYPPGGYHPVPYPWINGLVANRNCLLFTGGPTNPCTQTPTYPDLQFMYADLRSKYRVICTEPCYMP